MARGTELSPARRWALVNERLRRESRQATADEKFVQAASLMASVDDFGWREQLGADDEQVRELWMKLRAAWRRG